MNMNLDKTYCASPNCKNDCGRKLPDDYEQDRWKNPGHYAGKLISWGYFCGEPENTRVVNTFDNCVEIKEEFKHE